MTPRRPTLPQVKPTLSPERALLLLKKQLEVLQGLRKKHHQEGAQEMVEWRHLTQSIVERTFGNPSSNLTKDGYPLHSGTPNRLWFGDQSALADSMIDR